MRLAAWRTPLPALAALLVGYLLVPLAAFVARFATAAPADRATPGVVAALEVSLATASISTVIIAVGGIPLGYLLSQARGRLSDVLGVAVQLPLALPPLMSGILLIYLVGPYTPLGQLFAGRLTDDAVGIVLAQVFVAAPFLVVAARSGFAAVDPALAEVAATLGHRPWSRFLHVALPASAGAIRAGLLLSWLRAFGEFGATVVLAYHPYSLPVFTYVQFGSTGLATTLTPVGAALLAALLVLLLAAIQLRWRRRASRRPPLPPPRAPAATAAPRLRFALQAELGSFHLRLAHTMGGRHLAVLGPSGAGKSMLLRLLAGLLTPTEGSVMLGERNLSRLPPERRQIGYLPQDSALLPHLPVWRQITFGIDTDPALAAHWLQRLHLTGLEQRLPTQLSGGQRRRVALARALARQPTLLLLDEPFTGLDTPVRDQLRRELRQLQRDTSLTTVLVTHDPNEATMLADDVVLISDGQLLQAGPLPEVFAHPTTPHAARLLGIRNLHTGRVHDRDSIETYGLRLTTRRLDLPVGTPVTWCVRPEHIALTATGPYTATVRDTIALGGFTEVVLHLAGGCELSATTPSPHRSAPETTCQVAIPSEAIVVWPAERSLHDDRIQDDTAGRGDADTAYRDAQAAALQRE